MYKHKGWTFPDIDSHFRDSVGEFPECSYQQSALDTALKYVKQFNVAVDVGANIGLQSIRLAQKFKQVHAFEPTSLNYDCLTINAETFTNIKTYKTGLGESAHSTTIKLPTTSSNCGAFSIIDFADENENVYREEINIDLLDKFNLEVDFIKIDTQGFELFVVKGAKHTLANRPVLLLECEKKQEKHYLNEYLNPMGYRIVETVRKDSVWVAE